LLLATGMHGASLFEIWHEHYRLQNDWGKTKKYPSLLSGFGTTLVERALIEAFCRLHKNPFFTLLKQNQFGIDLDKIHSGLTRAEPGKYLASKPNRTVFLRHTVGLSDPLAEEDLSSEQRLDDGLPQSLESCIKTYGLRHFKIKINGDLDFNTERLINISDVISSWAEPDYAFTLDGNECFTDPEQLRILWEKISVEPSLKDFLNHIIFVEQPFIRSIALSAAVGNFIKGWKNRPPVIIDESDSTLQSFAKALSSGYSGTSHKNCKGIFKGIANSCFINYLREEDPESSLILSGEDLSTIGPVSLQQDLAVHAALGINSVERNGHHYFAGLSMFSDEIQKQVLKSHSDLFTASKYGWPTLNIKEGKIHLSSVNKAPFGVGFVPDLKAFNRIAHYQV
ncbi:MAG: hypothetical protein ABIA63_00310, partial [bacterium]